MVRRVVAGLEISTDDSESLLKRILVLTRYDVLVGVPSNEKARLNDTDLKRVKKTAKQQRLSDFETRRYILREANKASGGPSNAQLAYIHEFGSPANNIPPRPFLIPGIKSMRTDIVRMLRDAGRLLSDGKEDRAKEVLNALGLKAQSTVRRYITKGEGWPPLKPATLAARRRRGRTGTKPLIDTGQLRSSINYVVRKR